MEKMAGKEEGKCQKMCLFGSRKRRLQRRWRQHERDRPRRAFLGDGTINSVKIRGDPRWVKAKDP